MFTTNKVLKYFDFFYNIIEQTILFKKIQNPDVFAIKRSFIIFSFFLLRYSGLDSRSTSQFVSLMLDLTHKQGRTLVCTLHQPSALIFEKFDQVYVMTAGRCIYQGPPNHVIPYFAERAIVCPPYHNPADFRMYRHHLNERYVL